ncbi:MAG: alpha/beta hydrolase, partial [Chloroflexota bacterium]
PLTDYYPWNETGIERGRAHSEGAYYSTECYDEIIFNNQQVAESAAGATGSRFAEYLVDNVERVFDVCQMWGAGQASPLESEAVTSAAPALVLSGELDPVTPPDIARQVAGSLSNATFVSLPGLGHPVLEESDCARQLAARFIHDPSQPPEVDCLGDAAINFWLP